MKGAITSLPASPSLLSKLWCSIILVRGEDVMGGGCRVEEPLDLSLRSQDNGNHWCYLGVGDSPKAGQIST